MYSGVNFSVNTYGTGDLAVACTITITAGGAFTLSNPQTGNIGVGCKITYNTTDEAYIQQMTSSTTGVLKTNTGANPSTITGSTVVSIGHVYNSMASWELNVVTLVGNNPTTAGVSFGLPFYTNHDTGNADTADFNLLFGVAGAGTDATNRVTAWTPTGLGDNESILSSRYTSGGFPTTAARLEASDYFGAIMLQERHVDIIGIPIKETTTTQTGAHHGIHTYAAFASACNYKWEYNIIRRSGTFTTANTSRGINIEDLPASSVIYVRDNDIFDMNVGISANDSFSAQTWHIYNNTIVDCTTTGVYVLQWSASGTCNLINTNVFNCTDDYDVTTSGTVSITNNAYSQGTDPGTSGVNTSAIAGTTLFNDYAAGDLRLKTTATAIDNEGVGTGTTGVNATALDDGARGSSVCALGCYETLISSGVSGGINVTLIDFSSNTDAVVTNEGAVANSLGNHSSAIDGIVLTPPVGEIASTLEDVTSSIQTQAILTGSIAEAVEDVLANIDGTALSTTVSGTINEILENVSSNTSAILTLEGTISQTLEGIVADFLGNVISITGGGVFVSPTHQMLIEEDDTEIPLDISVDKDGGIVGLTVEVTIRDGGTTNSFLDFNDMIFKTSGWVSQTVTLTGIGGGSYVGAIDITAIQGLTSRHLVVNYSIAGAVTAVATRTVTVGPDVLTVGGFIALAD